MAVTIVHWPGIMLQSLFEGLRPAALSAIMNLAGPRERKYII